MAEVPHRVDVRPVYIQVMAAIGLVLAGYGGYLLWRAAASSRWPVTDGRVSESRVLSSPGRPDAATVRIEFTYTVGRAEYRSGQYREGAEGQGMSLAEAEARARAYPAGAAVRVAYDPADPADAVLEPGAAGYGWLFCFLGAFMAALGWAVARAPLLVRLLRLVVGWSH